MCPAPPHAGSLDNHLWMPLGSVVRMPQTYHTKKLNRMTCDELRKLLGNDSACRKMKKGTLVETLAKRRDDTVRTGAGKVLIICGIYADAGTGSQLLKRTLGIGVQVDLRGEGSEMQCDVVKPLVFQAVRVGLDEGVDVLGMYNWNADAHLRALDKTRLAQVYSLCLSLVVPISCFSFLRPVLAPAPAPYTAIRHRTHLSFDVEADHSIGIGQH